MYCLLGTSACNKWVQALEVFSQDCEYEKSFRILWFPKSKIRKTKNCICIFNCKINKHKMAFHVAIWKLLIW